MKVAVYSTRPYDRDALEEANREAGHELVFLEHALDERTAALADGFEAVCLFVNDEAGAAALERLHEAGVRLLVLRSAGFNHVDLEAAGRLGMSVLRVPAYSPHAVAEHTIALLLTLNRRIHRAWNRVREHDFSLHGLMGFDLADKTCGVVGTGRIGTLVARILLGFGCRVIATDPCPDDELAAAGVDYADLDELLEQSHVITLQCPLTPETHHLLDERRLARTRRGVFVVNTSRGAVIDTRAVIAGLKSGHVGGLAVDVYEEEADLFFRDLSDQVIEDELFVRLLSFPNVLVTAHQAFFTREAMTAIAETTISNVSAFAAGRVPEERRVTTESLAG